MSLDPSERDRLETESEIHRALLAYTRGIDRLDGELVASAFHPGAELEGYGRPGSTTIEAFVDHAIPSLSARYQATQHRISNTWIDLRDDHAVVETYVSAHHHRTDAADEDAAGEGTASEDPAGKNAQDRQAEEIAEFAGRYVDRFEPDTDGAWKIRHRCLLTDWTKVSKVTKTMLGDWTHGTRNQSDPSYGQKNAQSGV